ncbi:FAD-dependent oxidoreductase [Adlercreutzia sp. R25]|uniref:Urocanate reductase n=1 Tax=Adlercreutzia shanghongiae TaxID=3111773 RepID=A0ABU6IXA5_9ACTN|nr:MULTISPECIES: FAD-dependent oxidoreductase [unclassified Adlercreutzia]MEC4272465.1 FAD-dependent oxidoreductase [Adlercreutzia sp. R25]MEC4294328.1 FAD-dependent oxidoreductase [Adlercreutzia sp. R22]
MGKFTRRQFITGGAAGVAAIAGLGLAGCAPQAKGEKAMAATGEGSTFADTIAWDGEYDVVVIGFGAAGAVSACYAADAGAKVLLLDKAPQGMEGGNSRFCGQIILNSDNKESMLAYNKAMAGDFEIDEELFDVYAEGLTQTKNMLRDFFGVPEENFMDWKYDSTPQPLIGMFAPEYPELEGGEDLHVLTVSDNVCNSALWKVYRNKVLSMSDNIDVWYMSPGVSLFQDPVSKAVIGVEVDKAGETVNIRAKNGVVMTMGGFENNKQMVEDYLGLTKSTPAGTLFNTGDGIKMAMGVGADLWHMEAFEGNCFALGGISFVVPEDQHAKTFNDLRNLSGSIVVVGNGGERYLREDVYNRHGHVPSNGDWISPKRPRSTYMVWDAAQNKAITEEYHGIPAGFEDQVVTANTIAELESALGIPAGKLEQTITDFNKMANDGYDPAFYRAAETMRAFGEGPFYAIEMIQAFLNTQGGARRNARAEVVGVDGEPIPHLYSAGEFGGMTPYQYNGGGNMAECLIFGSLAGANAAVEKDPLPALPMGVVSEIVYTQGSGSHQVDPDPTQSVQLGEGEYLGTSKLCMGNELAVKVTMNGDKIAAIEVVQQQETAGVGSKALDALPAQIIEAQSTEVDAVAGATVSSTALKDAVNNALAQVK